MRACVLMPVDSISFFVYRLEQLLVAVVVVVAIPSPATDRSQGAGGLAQYGGQSVATAAHCTMK